MATGLDGNAIAYVSAYKQIYELANTLRRGEAFGQAFFEVTEDYLPNASPLQISCGDQESCQAILAVETRSR